MEQPTTASTVQPAKMQAYVKYMTNVSIVGEKDAMLEWSADDHIRIYEIDTTTQKATAVLLDTTVASIQKVGGSLAYLVLFVDGKKYRMEFSVTTTAGIAAGGVLGDVYAYNSIKKSGIPVWVAAFKAQNIKTSYLSFGKIFGITFAVLGVIVVVVVIVAVVIAASS